MEVDRLGDIAHEAKRIAATIEELYRWKATGPHDVEPEPVNMVELVEHVLREANHRGAVEALDKATRLLAQAQPGPALQPGDDQRQWWDEATALLRAGGQ